MAPIDRIKYNLENDRYKGSLDGFKISDDIEGILVDFYDLQEITEKLVQLFVDTCTEWPEWFSEFVAEHNIKYDKPDCY